jgi:Fe-S cluster assembly protein SufD
MNALRGIGAEGFLARYEGLKERLPGDPAAREAAAAVLRRGFPGQRVDAWKYTSLRPVAEARFHEALTEAGDHIAPLALPHLGALADRSRIVLAAGRLREDLSILPEGFSRFADAPGLAAAAEDDVVGTLNTVLAEDGAILHVPAGVDAGTVLLIHLGADLYGTAAAFHPRHAVRLGADARLTLVEISVGDGVYLHNPVLTADIGAGARLAHYRLQAEAEGAFHLASVRARIEARGSYDSFTLTLGAGLSRSEIHAVLEGEHGHAALNAAQLLRGRQHGDFTTVVRHAAPTGASRQTVKNVLAGHARGVFQGKIEVARAAQKTDGYQMNQALLLSRDAEIDVKPQLEIYADDVKCSHGATVGELDAEQLFYMISRGIPAAEARGMLVRAFLAEALDMVTDDAVRGVFEDRVAAWWEGQAA